MKKFLSRMAMVAVAFAVCLAIFYTSRWAYRSFTQQRFSSYICEYDRQTERDAAWAGFNLAKSALKSWERETYKERLNRLEVHYQHRYASALSNFFDPEFGKEKKVDSFDQVLTDISFRLGRDESPGKEVWELCRTHGEIACIAWPFILEDLGMLGWPQEKRTISYQEYLEWKSKLEPAKERMETLLAKHGK